MGSHGERCEQPVLRRFRFGSLSFAKRESGGSEFPPPPLVVLPCYFILQFVESDSNCMQYVNAHVLASFSYASNLPGSDAEVIIRDSPAITPDGLCLRLVENLEEIQREAKERYLREKGKKVLDLLNIRMRAAKRAGKPGLEKALYRAIETLLSENCKLQILTYNGTFLLVGGQNSERGVEQRH